MGEGNSLSFLSAGGLCPGTQGTPSLAVPRSDRGLPRAGSSGRRRGVYVSHLLMEKQRTGPVAGGSWLALRKPRDPAGHGIPHRHPRFCLPEMGAVSRLQERDIRIQATLQMSPGTLSWNQALDPVILMQAQPCLGQRGCELWESRVSQEESGGPS